MVAFSLLSSRHLCFRGLGATKIYNLGDLFSPENRINKKTRYSETENSKHVFFKKGENLGGERKKFSLAVLTPTKIWQFCNNRPLLGLWAFFPTLFGYFSFNFAVERPQ